MKLYNTLRNIINATLEHNTGTKALDKIVHVPVLANEIIETLSPQDGQHFIDMTFGGGGHTKRLLTTQKRITIFALDRDPEAFQRAIVLSKDLANKKNGQTLIPLLGRFSELNSLMNNFQVPHNFFDGAIMDLGASSFQFENGSRGFSLKLNGPLDMRMDCNRFPNMPSAADVINSLDAEDLAKIFRTYGEEKQASKVAHAIVDSRFMMKSLNSTGELAILVSSVLGNVGSDKLGRPAHSATKVFQALRIFVNNELNELNYGIELLSRYMKIGKCPNKENIVTTDRYGGGLLAAISFHSLEDKLLKRHFMGLDESSQVNPLEYGVYDNSVNLKKRNKKWSFYKDRLFYPSEKEVLLNPRARSAKLRIAVRLD